MKYLALPLLLVFLGSLAQAEDPKNDRELCRLVHEMKSEMPGTTDFMWEMLSVKFRPGKYSKPQAISIENQSPVSGPQGSKNLVISFGLPESPIEEREGESRFKQLQKDYKPFQKAVRKLYKTETQEECETVAKKNPIDWEKMDTLAQEAHALQPYKIWKESSKAQKVIEAAIESSTEPWEFVPVSELNVLKDILRSPETENVVLVLHGTSDGRLLNSFLEELPRGLFKDLSPSLRSLSIFACYTKTIVEFYELESQLAQQRSIYAQRFLFAVQTKPYLGQDGEVPLQGFKTYFKMLDKKLGSEKPLFGNGPALLPQPLCTLSTEKLNLQSGSLGVFVDQTFVGNQVPNDTGTTIQFPCRFLDPNRKTHIVLFRPLSTYYGATLNGTEGRACLRTPGSFSCQDLRHFFGGPQNDQYRSSKVSF